MRQSAPLTRVLVAAACITLLLLPGLRPALAGSAPVGWQVVVPHRVMPLIHRVDGVGIDRSNTIYLWDSLEARIETLSPAGTVLHRWSVPRSASSTEWAPNRLAVDSGGNSSVLTNDIRRYSSAGRLLAHWGTSPNAVSVAAGGSGNIFVLSGEGKPETDRVYPAGGDARIHKYSPQGMLLATWRTPTIRQKDVVPDGIAVDTHGNVLVTVATDNSCTGVCAPSTSVLYRFTPTGRITQTYHHGGKVFGSIAGVDHADNVYVLTHTAGFAHMSILKLTPDGKRLAQSPRSGGPIRQHLLAGVGANGRVVVTSSNASGSQAWQQSAVVRVLSPALMPVAQYAKFLYQPVYPMGLGFTLNRDGSLVNGLGLTVNGAGTRLYLTGAPSQYIYRVMTPTGTILLQVNNPPGPVPLVWYARSIAVDHAGNVYIDDWNGSQIVKFSPSGVHLATFPLAHAYKGGSDGMALDAQGNMYVTAQSHVLKLSPTGVLLGDFAGLFPGLIGGPSDVVVDRMGDIYVADTFNHRIQKLSPAGHPVRIWHDPTSFSGPVRLAIDPTTGHIWVAYFKHSPLQEFTPEGVLVARHGEYGVFPGQIIEPNALAFDRNGVLYVADYGNNRIQRYRS